MPANSPESAARLQLQKDFANQQMFSAIFRKDITTLDLALKKGADIRSLAPNGLYVGDTVLHAAQQSISNESEIDFLKELIARGADMFQQNKNGESAVSQIHDISTNLKRNVEALYLSMMPDMAQADTAVDMSEGLEKPVVLDARPLTLAVPKKPK